MPRHRPLRPSWPPPTPRSCPTIIDRLRDRAGAALLGQAASRRSFLDAEARALTRLFPDIDAARQRSADLLDRGWRTVADRVERRRLSLEAAHDALRTLSPTATLERGYAVARTPDGRIVHDAATLHEGDALQVIVARGSADTRVERTGSEELVP